MDIRHDGVVLVFVDAKDTHIIAPSLKADDPDGWEARWGSMGSIQTRTSGAARKGDDSGVGIPGVMQRLASGIPSQLALNLDSDVLASAIGEDGGDIGLSVAQE